MTFHGVAVEGSEGERERESESERRQLAPFNPFVVRVFWANRKVGHVVDFVVKRTLARGLKGLKAKGNKMKSFKYFYYYYYYNIGPGL